MCASGSEYGICIRGDFKCDNKIHCYDAEDENDCGKYKVDAWIFSSGLKVNINKK